MKFDRSFFNIILLGISFLLMLTTSLTGTAIQEIVVASVNRDYSESWNGFQWNAYNSLGSLNFIAAIASWFIPPVIAVLGPKRSLFLGGTLICLAFSTFLYPLKYGLWAFSVIMGFANPVAWGSQGNYLTVMSSKNDITRNTGMHWSIFQMSSVVGNCLVAYLFNGQEEITKETRIATYSALLALGVCGIFTTLFLRGVRQAEVNEVRKSPIQAFRNSVKVMKTKKMILLAFTFLFTGFEIAFFAGVYSASIGFTKSFGPDRKKYTGESGIMIGLGEVFGGLGFLLTAGRKGSRFVIVAAYFLYLLSLLLVYINLPVYASLYETDERALIHSSLPVALLCAFLLGFCDACYQTQIYQFIATNYNEDSAPPFSILISIQAISMGSMYFISNLIGLHIHVFILTLAASLGTFGFLAADRISRREKVVPEASITAPQSIFISSQLPVIPE